VELTYNPQRARYKVAVISNHIPKDAGHRVLELMPIGKSCCKSGVKQLDPAIYVGKLLTVLASQSIPSWNRVVFWLKQMETLRENAA
jgi:hypothetical protein